MRKVVQGTLFQIPIDEDRAATGCVVRHAGIRKSPCVLAVFDGFDDPSGPLDIDAIQFRAVVLQGVSFAVLIENGRWPVVGALDPSRLHTEMPEFKTRVGTSDVWMVVDYRGSPIRRATRKEAADLPIAMSVGPIRFENASLARAGLRPWEASFDDIVAEPGVSRSPRSLDEVIARIRDR